MPLELLGPQGYLNSQQNSSMREMGLITAGDCTLNLQGKNRISLSEFDSLRTFSWIGLRSSGDLDALKSVLRLNYGHLEKLNLDLVSEFHDEDDYSFHAGNILDLHTGNDNTIFPFLTELSLDSIPFEGSEAKLVRAFNMHKLSRLSLRQCTGWEELLSQAMEAGRLDSLVSLEVSFLIDGSEAGYIWNLVKDSNNLRDLYISLLADPNYRPNPFKELARMELRLTRLVYHTRAPHVFDDDGNDDDNDEDCDWDEADPFPVEDQWWQADHPYATLKCLGLSCRGPILV